MNKLREVAVLGCLAVFLCQGNSFAQCPSTIDVKGDTPLHSVNLPPTQKCSIKILDDGYTVPDLSCTPGAFNPTVTLEVLKKRHFKISCIQNKATEENAKNSGSVKGTKEETYEWYGVTKNKTCELDHLIPLELGGADTLDNIWPQCGRNKKKDILYKKKDSVEKYLVEQVKSGHMSLQEAREGIASDWTRFLQYVK